MDGQKLKVIQELMDQLVDEMEYSPEDLSERLGRKMPEKEGMTVVKIEGKGMPGLEKAEEKLGMSLDGDMEEGESPEHQAKVFGRDSYEDDEMDPDEMLKKRVMKLRG